MATEVVLQLIISMITWKEMKKKSNTVEVTHKAFLAFYKHFTSTVSVTLTSVSSFSLLLCVWFLGGGGGEGGIFPLFITISFFILFLCSLLLLTHYSYPDENSEFNILQRHSFICY